MYKLINEYIQKINKQNIYELLIEKPPKKEAKLHSVIADF